MHDQGYQKLQQKARYFQSHKKGNLRIAFNALIQETISWKHTHTHTQMAQALISTIVNWNLMVKKLLLGKEYCQLDKTKTDTLGKASLNLHLKEN